MDLIQTPSMLKFKGRYGMAYFIADPHCGGLALYELFLALIAHPEIYAVYEKKYGKKTKLRINAIRQMNKQNLQLALVKKQMDILYHRYNALGEKDSREPRLNKALTKILEKIWKTAGEMEPLHYMLVVDTVYLLHHCDVGMQTLSSGHITAALNQTLKYSTDKVMQ